MGRPSTIQGTQTLTVNGVWEAEVVWFAGSGKRKFSIAVHLQQKFPSCTPRTKVEVPGRFFSSSSHPGGSSWSCILDTGTSLGLWAHVPADVRGKGDWDVVRLSTWLKLFNQALNWFDGSSKLAGSLHPA